MRSGPQPQHLPSPPPLMMQPPHAAAPWVTIVHLVLLAISALLSVLACVITFLSRSRNAPVANSLYKDENGEATEQTQQRYKAAIRAPLVISAIISLAGLGTAVAFGIGDIFEIGQRHRSSLSGLSSALSPLLVWVSVVKYDEAR